MSIKQGAFGMTTLDWTPVSQAIDEHSYPLDQWAI